MLEKLTPRPEQEEAILQVLRDKAHLSKAEGGAGKTLVGTEAYLRSGARVCLVVAPLNTRSGWEKMLTRQSQGGVPFTFLKTGKALEQGLQSLYEGTPGMYFIGWQMFARLGWSKAPLDFVILDESHRFQNRKSRNAIAANTLIKTEYKLCLSATPAGNNLYGLWQSQHWLWPAQTQAFWPWVTRYFRTERDPYAGKKILGEKEPGTIWESLPSKSYFRSPYQREPLEYEVQVKMSPAQQKLYDRFEREAVVWLDEHPLVAELPAVQAMRLRQLTLAVPSIRLVEKTVTNEAGVKEPTIVEEVYFADDAKSSKIDAVLDVLSDLYVDGPKPVLMFTHSRRFAEILNKRLQAAGYESRWFVGGMGEVQREWKKQNFGVEFDIMVATIATIGEGTDGLQDKCHIEFWLSLEDNRLLNRQAAWRLSRDGQKHTVLRYRFVAEASVETRQAGRLATDQQLLDQSI